jgi:hypothetical protein
MTLVNMEMSQEEAKEQYGASIAADAPKYPYGLCLRLDEEALSKLGMAALPKVGQTMMITARVSVQSVSERESMEGEKEQDVSLQITDMELAADKPAGSPEKALYGEGAQS